MALGIGSDYYNLKNMDVIVCSRENNNVDISHYFLEDKNSQPFEHRSRIRLIDFGIDNESGISWCTFVRPQRPVSISQCTDMGSLIGNFNWIFHSVEIWQFSCHQDFT